MISGQNVMMLADDSVNPPIEPTPQPVAVYEQGSVLFKETVGAYATRIINKANTNNKKGVISFAVKRSTLNNQNRQHLYQSTNNASPYTNNSVTFEPDERLMIDCSYQLGPGSGWATQLKLTTWNVFRETSNWAHVYFAWDTTQPIESERARLVVNGKRVYDLLEAIYPSKDSTLRIDALNNINAIGDSPGKGVFTQSTFFGGYITEYNRIDGWVPSVDHFGEYDSNGYWKIKPYIQDERLSPYAADPYFANVVLFPVIEYRGDAGYVLVDKSDNVKTLSMLGDVRIVKNAMATADDYLLGSNVLEFSGVNGYVECALSDDLQLGGTYTIEVAVKPFSLPGNFGIINKGLYHTYGTWEDLDYSVRSMGSVMRFYFFGNTVYDEQILDIPNPLTIGKTTQIAICRAETTAYILIDGVLKGTVSSLSLPGPHNRSMKLGVWEYDVGSFYFHGQMGQIRITKGISRYTNSYTTVKGDFLPSTSVIGNNGFRLSFKDRSNVTNFFNETVANQTFSLNKTFDDLTGWTVSQAYTGVNAIATTSGGYLSAADYGTGSSWHGPQITKQFPETGDFDITFDGINFGNVASDIGHMLLSVGGMFYFSMSDAWDNSTPGLEGYTFGIIENGTTTAGSANASQETLVNAKVRLTRSANVFTCYMNDVQKYQVMCPITPVARVDIIFARYSSYVEIPMNLRSVALTATAYKQWTPVGFTLPNDAINDTPYGLSGTVTGNYPTLDPLGQVTPDNAVAIFDGNLRAILPQTNGGATGGISSIYPLQDGQYVEITVSNISRLTYYADWIGVCLDRYAPWNDFIGIHESYSGSGTAPGVVKRVNNNQTYLSAGAIGENLVVGIAYYQGHVWLRLSGTWVTGAPSKTDFSQATGTFLNVSQETAYVTVWGRDVFHNHTFNFGQRDFANTIDNGFGAMPVTSWAAPAIVKPSLHHDTNVYLGDGTNGRAVKFFNFDAEISWHKARNDTINHIWFNRSRGNDLGLLPNLNLAESPYTDAHSFGSNGMETLGYTTSGGPSYEVNKAGTVYSVWGWAKSQLAGIDVVLYNGTPTPVDIPHNLADIPDVVIYKQLNAASDWTVATHLTGIMTEGYLNRTNAFVSSSLVKPTATTFQQTTRGMGVVDGGRFMATLIKGKRGYSKVCIYNGKSKVYTPSVYCGFKPRFAMIKQITGEPSHWYMFDSLRSTYNPVKSQLEPNLINSESFGVALDFTSTGITLRSNSTGSFNGLGEQYLLIAFAETPAQYGLAC